MYTGKVPFDPGPPEFRLMHRGHLRTVHVAFWKRRQTHNIVRKPDGLILATHGTWGACGVPLIGSLDPENTKGARFVHVEDFRLSYRDFRLCQNCLRMAEARQWLLDGNWKLDPVVPPQFANGDPMNEMDSAIMRAIASMGSA